MYFLKLSGVNLLQLLVGFRAGEKFFYEKRKALTHTTIKRNLGLIVQMYDEEW